MLADLVSDTRMAGTLLGQSPADVRDGVEPAAKNQWWLRKTKANMPLPG